jgi:uncharacterized membrane protein
LSQQEQCDRFNGPRERVTPHGYPIIDGRDGSTVNQSLRRIVPLVGIEAGNFRFTVTTAELGSGRGRGQRVGFRGTGLCDMAASSSSVRSSLWFIPVMCVIAGVVVSIGTIAIDRWFEFEAVPRWLTGGPDAASSILETIAVSMVSLAALVLTITMVVVQLAMGQFSPRIVQTFLRDRPSQLAIGLFVATFAHAMLTMREVQFNGEGQVPGVAIAVGYVLVLTSIAMLVLYVNHIGQSLRVSALIELVGTDTRRLLDRYYPDQLDDVAPPGNVIAAPRSGVLVGVDRQRLIELATASNCVFHIMPALGEFVPAGAPLVSVDGEPTGLDEQAVTDALRSGLERTLDEDLAYGFRMLVDMAERSLSDSPFTDPTTAVQCIDRLHDGLRQLATRRIPDGRLYDNDGVLRVTVPTMGWNAYVRLALDEIRLAGAQSPQVARRLSAALDDLLDVAPTARRPVLEQQLDLLHQAVTDSSRAAPDVDFALQPDSQGIGVAASVLRSMPDVGEPTVNDGHRPHTPTSKPGESVRNRSNSTQGSPS